MPDMASAMYDRGLASQPLAQAVSFPGAESFGTYQHDEAFEIRICSVRGCTNHLHPESTNKMCEGCRIRHRAYATTKRARRKMEKAAVAGLSLGLARRPSEAEWVHQEPASSWDTSIDPQLFAESVPGPSTIAMPAHHHEQEHVQSYSPPIYAPILMTSSSSELAGALTPVPFSAPNPNPSPSPTVAPNTPTCYENQNNNKVNTHEAEVTLVHEIAEERPSSDDDDNGGDESDSTSASASVPVDTGPLRPCSVKGCKAIIPSTYKYKMCPPCRTRYRTYGTTKRAKWKAERETYDRELAGLRMQEDERRKAAGERPLSELPDELAVWEQMLLDEQFPALDPPELGDANDMTALPFAARMCTVSHCHKILPGAYRFKRCAQHRMQNRYHSQLKRVREKGEKEAQMEAVGATFPAREKAPEVESKSSSSGTGMDEYVDQNGGRGEEAMKKEVEEDEGEEDEDETDGDIKDRGSDTGSTKKRKHPSHTCATPECQNLLAPRVRWRHCGVCRARERVIRREQRNKERREVERLRAVAKSTQMECGTTGDTLPTSHVHFPLPMPIIAPPSTMLSSYPQTFQSVFQANIVAPPAAAVRVSSPKNKLRSHTSGNNVPATCPPVQVGGSGTTLASVELPPTIGSASGSMGSTSTCTTTTYTSSAATLMGFTPGHPSRVPKSARSSSSPKTQPKPKPQPTNNINANANPNTRTTFTPTLVPATFSLPLPSSLSLPSAQSATPSNPTSASTSSLQFREYKPRGAKLPAMGPGTGQSAAEAFREMVGRDQRTSGGVIGPPAYVVYRSVMVEVGKNEGEAAAADVEMEVEVVEKGEENENENGREEEKEKKEKGYVSASVPFVYAPPPPKEKRQRTRRKRGSGAPTPGAETVVLDVDSDPPVAAAAIGSWPATASYLTPLTQDHAQGQGPTQSYDTSPQALMVAAQNAAYPYPYSYYYPPYMYPPHPDPAGAPTSAPASATTSSTVAPYTYASPYASPYSYPYGTGMYNYPYNYNYPYGTPCGAGYPPPTGYMQGGTYGVGVPGPYGASAGAGAVGVGAKEGVPSYYQTGTTTAATEVVTATTATATTTTRKRKRGGGEGERGRGGGRGRGKNKGTVATSAPASAPPPMVDVALGSAITTTTPAPVPIPTPASVPIRPIPVPVLIPVPTKSPTVSGIVPPPIVAQCISFDIFSPKLKQSTDIPTKGFSGLSFPPSTPVPMSALSLPTPTTGGLSLPTLSQAAPMAALSLPTPAPAPPPPPMAGLSPPADSDPASGARPCLNKKTCHRLIPADVMGSLCERCRTRMKKRQAKARQRFKLEPKRSLFVRGREGSGLSSPEEEEGEEEDEGDVTAVL